MRQNPSFTLADLSDMRQLISEHPWATVVSGTPQGPVASHYAVLLDEDRSDLTVVAHMGRPDDAIHELGKHELLLVFQGAHGYISPGWYGDDAAVPTWNYSAVHLSGVPEILSDEENLLVLDRLVAHFERQRADPRYMWERPNDEAFVRRLAAGTVGFRLTPTTVVAKRKHSQNRPADAVDRVLAELDGTGPFSSPELAAEMRRTHQRMREAQQ